MLKDKNSAGGMPAAEEDELRDLEIAMRSRGRDISNAAHGDKFIVTNTELGDHRTQQILRRSKSARVIPARELYDNGERTNLVFSQQLVHSSHKVGGLVPRTTAITATGYTKAGDAMAATYMAHWRASFGEQAETLRFGTTSIFLDCGEATDVFGFVGPWHLIEHNSFLQAEFEEVSINKVATSALLAARDWTRGKSLVWMKLPSIAAAQAAADLRSKLRELEDLEGPIARAIAQGELPDPRLLRRYEGLRVGLDAYWFFVGIQRTVEIEREPSVAAIKAVKG